MSVGEYGGRRAPAGGQAMASAGVRSRSTAKRRAEVATLLESYVVSRDYDARRLRTQGRVGGGRSSWTSRAESRLVEFYDPRVRAAVERAQRRYAFVEIDVDAAVAEGRWGVVRALWAYDPERGPFDSLVALRIHSAVRDYVQDAWRDGRRGATFLRRLWAAGALGTDPDPSTWPDAETVAQRWRDIQRSQSLRRRGSMWQGLRLTAADVEAIFALGHPVLTLLPLDDDARGPEAAYEDPVGDEAVDHEGGDPDDVRNVIAAALLDLSLTHPVTAKAVAAEFGMGRSPSWVDAGGGRSSRVAIGLELLAMNPSVREARRRLEDGHSPEEQGPSRAPVGLGPVVTIDDLYTVPPRRFVSQRNALAAEADLSGDTCGAGRIRALRRPKTSAWLANLLVRCYPDEIGRLVDLGTTFRSGKDRPVEVQHPVEQAKLTVGTLVHNARRFLGNRRDLGALVELRQTLEAAFVDAEAARMLRSGRLTSPLRPSGELERLLRVPPLVSLARVRRYLEVTGSAAGAGVPELLTTG